MRLNRYPYTPNSFRPVFLSAGVLLMLIASGLVPPVQAQDKAQQPRGKMAYEAVQPGWTDCGLRKEAVNAFVSRRPSPAVRRKAKSATIEVEYGSGFSPEARQAFQRAAEIWERHVRSDVTITVDAAFEELGTDVLGGAGPQFVYTNDTDGDGRADAFFGDALLDARTGANQSEGEPDIVARFNSGRDDWHFGEGDAPAGTIDFTTIVLHEIGHGLNYFAQSNVDDTGSGEYGVVDFNQDGRPDGIPSVFTLFLTEQAGDGTLTPLTNESAFPNPSQALGEALTGDRLVFDGEESNEAADGSDGPTLAKMYAPASYEQGSSISHLDEETYGFEGENSLMTPEVAAAETIRLPGPIMCGQLADMGWGLGPQCQQYFQDVNVELGNPSVSVGASGRATVELRWTVPPGTPETVTYRVERAPGAEGGTFRDVEGTLRQQSSQEYRFTAERQTPGQYQYRVVSQDEQGNEFKSPAVPVDIPLEGGVFIAGPSPNPVQNQAVVQLTAQETQDAMVEIYDAIGERIYAEERQLEGQRPVRLVVNTHRWSSGVYFLRVRARDFTKTRKMVVVR